MPARVVCISQETGSEGVEVGLLVAETLGFRHVDDEIVRRAAEREQLDEDVVADVERRKSFVRRMLDGLSGIAPLEAGILPLPDPPPPDTALRQLIREVIADTADEGEVVIVSHAASIALAGRPDVLRVLVTASEEIRARRLEGLDLLGFDEARRRVAATDAARADYLRRFYGVEEEVPTLYDLVVSTDVLRPEQAANVIVAAVRA
jgi:cytidylate kinase